MEIMRVIECSHSITFLIQTTKVSIFETHGGSGLISEDNFLGNPALNVNF